MENYSEVANSSILWFITFLVISLILFQIILFLKKSFIAGKQIGLEKNMMYTAFKVGAISAIGPSIVLVIGMVSLLVVVGGPTALTRLVYIGNIAYELLAVEFASNAYGVSANDSYLPAEIFSVALWCMAVGCIGWIVVTAAFTDKMEKIKEHLSKKKNSAKLLPALSTAAMLGAYGYLNANYAISFDKNTISLFVGFIVMLLMIYIYKKKCFRWANEWGLTIAMISGMVIAALF